jgi:hypothetical protein
LTNLSPSERYALLEKLYIKAKKNVTEYCPNEKDSKKIEILIRNECDRLLQEWIEENS